MPAAEVDAPTSASADPSDAPPLEAPLSGAPAEDGGEKGPDESQQRPNTADSGPPSSPTGETGARRSLKVVSKKVLAKVHLQHAFGTLVHNARVDDDLKLTDMTRLRTLGKGSFGEVALYEWKPGVTHVVDGVKVARQGHVAVKLLLPQTAHSKVAIQDFKAETAILSRLQHSCLVGCIGSGLYSTGDGPPSLFLAMEAVTCGDLRRMVISAVDTPWVYRVADALRWGADIARGLNYLHTRSPMLIHRDLKLENVLLDAQWNAKLTDFGLVKLIKRSHHGAEADKTESELYRMTGGTGSLKYMAPESFKGQAAGASLDIYALAIVLWELRAKKPLLFQRCMKTPAGITVEYTAAAWAADAARGKRPELPEEWGEPLRLLIRQCWAAAPAARPTSCMAIAERLHAIEAACGEARTDPRKPNLPPGHKGGQGGCCAVQ